jgi:DNA-binding LytR/AlgR family response regulator
MPALIRVLIVEDKPDEAAALREVLEKVLGFQVTNSITDLANYKQARSNLAFDVAIVDIQLGGRGNTDGWSIAEDILVNHQLPVLVHTGNNPASVWASIPEHRLLDIVSKPANPDQWRNAVAKMIFKANGKTAAENFQMPDGHSSAEQLFELSRPDFFLNGTRLRFKHLYYIFNNKDSITVHYKRGEVKYTAKLEGLLSHVNHHQLVQVHRNYVVNWNFVEEIEGKKLHLILPPLPDETTERSVYIPIGPKFSDEVNARRNDFRNGKGT